MSAEQIATIRKRITQTPKKEIKMALTLQYLACGRSKEIVAVTAPNDKSGKNLATGPKGTDTRIDSIGDFEFALFNIYTQKRDGLRRIIALPLKFESMAEPLHNYVQSFGKDSVFNFTRQKLWKESKKRFDGLTYDIAKYSIYENGELKKTVEKKKKNFTTHALRHLRAAELVEYYGFTGFDLATYGGWTMSTTVQVSAMFDRYVSLDWRSYASKLLKTRNW